MCIANTLTQGVQIFNIELQLSATCPVVSMLTFLCCAGQVKFDFVTHNAGYCFQIKNDNK